MGQQPQQPQQQHPQQQSIHELTGKINALLQSDHALKRRIYDLERELDAMSQLVEAKIKFIRTCGIEGYSHASDLIARVEKIKIFLSKKGE